MCAVCSNVCTVAYTFHLQQRDEAQEQLMEVVEENARLELEKRSSFNESVSLEEELTQARLQVAPSGETSPYFIYLGSAHRVFNLHVLRSCASSIFTYFSFMSFCITLLHLTSGIPIFQCPPTTDFHLPCSHYFFSLFLHVS